MHFGPPAKEGEISTLADLLRLRSRRQPDTQSYTFLFDGETEEVNLTYGELDRQAQAIAVMLEELGARGERALLLYPPGLEYIAAFFGCLYAGRVAVPAYPPDPARLARTLPRLQAIIEDAQALVVLTTSSLLSLAKSLFKHAPDLAKLKWLATDRLDDGLEYDVEKAYITGDTLAFLQYTSGSTGTPKGVMLTHENLLHNAGLVYYAFDHAPGDSYVSWLPTFHDMGFMAGVLQPLYGGFHAVLMPPISFLQNPSRWLQAVSRYRATTSGGPNFAYDLCVRKVGESERASLDLSSWSVAFNGAEPVRSITLERFARAFEPCGFRKEAFYPCYGLAEATLIVSGGNKHSAPVTKAFQTNALENNFAVTSVIGEESHWLVGCGKGLPTQTIITVNPESLRRGLPGEVGEIWISGSSVAIGYWNRPQETEQTFQARISEINEGPFLRTGDLGFLLDGELFITGRLKDLIIIRGLNYYPQDIEMTVERCDLAVRPGCGAAFSIEVDGEERLALAQEVETARQPDMNALIDAIRQAVVDHHELQAHAIVLLKPGSIPKTSSGKIQRHACRMGFLDKSLDEIARSVIKESKPLVREESFIRKALLAVDGEKRRNLLEAYMQEQMARALGVATSQVGPHRGLSALGLDSLLAIELKTRLEMELGVNVAVTDLLSLTISDLALRLADQLQSLPPPSLLPVDLEAETEYDLSYGQQALWFLDQIAPESAAYNISFAASVLTPVDSLLLRRAFQVLVDRHPSLRTTFTMRGGHPVQLVHKNLNVEFEEIEAAALSQSELDESLIERAHRPFDLERGPVMRVTLFTRSLTQKILLLTVHHIVFDGWSLWVLLNELIQAYRPDRLDLQERLIPDALPYSSFVRWQREMLKGSEGQRLSEYWERELAGDLPVLKLPTIRPRSPVQTFRGASEAFDLDDDLVNRLRALAASEGATLYMVLLAAFAVLLHRYTHQEDILIGSPVSARNQAGFENLVGCFFNVVILRADLSGDPAFDIFLGRMREKVLGSLEHQDYPSHLLAERHQASRDLSHPPLFQTTFILQKPYHLRNSSLLLDESATAAPTEGLALKIYPLKRMYARTDLELEMIDAGRSVSGWFQYNTDLFDGEAIARMSLHFKTILESLTTNPEQRLSDLKMLTDAERRQVVFDWSRLEKNYSRPVCVHTLFEEQAEKTPHQIATCGCGDSLTYEAVNERADKLASLIKRLQK